MSLSQGNRGVTDGSGGPGFAAASTNMPATRHAAPTLPPGFAPEPDMCQIQFVTSVAGHTGIVISWFAIVAAAKAERKTQSTRTLFGIMPVIKDQITALRRHNA